ncbi:hypothetical protein [Coleofasciculus sp.]
MGDLTDGAAVYDLHCILRWNDYDLGLLLLFVVEVTFSTPS